MLSGLVTITEETDADHPKEKLKTSINVVGKMTIIAERKSDKNLWFIITPFYRSTADATG